MDIVFATLKAGHNRSWNDLSCVGCDVKHYSLTQCTSAQYLQDKCTAYCTKSHCLAKTNAHRHSIETKLTKGSSAI